MRSHPRRLSTCILAIVLIVATPLIAAAPRLIMFSGTGLEQPVVLTDWRANLDLMLALEDTRHVTADRLKDRPYLLVGFFWGPRWNAFMDAGRPLSELRHEDTGHHGRFYPAIRDLPAVFLQTYPSSSSGTAVPKSVEDFGKGGVLSDRTVAMLKERGIPVSIAGPRRN